MDPNTPGPRKGLSLFPPHSTPDLHFSSQDTADASLLPNANFSPQPFPSSSSADLKPNFPASAEGASKDSLGNDISVVQADLDRWTPPLTPTPDPHSSSQHTVDASDFPASVEGESEDNPDISTAEADLDRWITNYDRSWDPPAPVRFVSYQQASGSNPPKPTTVLTADPPPTTTSQETPFTFSTDPKIFSSWVYLDIIERSTNQALYAFNVHTAKSLRLPPLPESLLNSAILVFNRKLYVIGGSGRDGNPSRKVYMYNPFTVPFTWLQLPDMHTPRQNAVAAATNGRICVFGGRHYPHLEDDLPWAEEYDLSAFRWTAIEIPAPEFSFSHSGHLIHAVVFRHQIFIRNISGGIAYNAMSSTWENIPEDISGKWCRSSSGVEVAGMLVTYYKGGNGEARLGAYEQESRTWFPLQNLLVVYHNPEMKFHFLAVNGKLVVYHMWESPQPLTFAVMKVLKRCNPRLRVEIRKTLHYPRPSEDSDLAGAGLAVAATEQGSGNQGI